MHEAGPSPPKDSSHQLAHALSQVTKLLPLKPESEPWSAGHTYNKLHHSLKYIAADETYNLPPHVGKHAVVPVPFMSEELINLTSKHWGVSPSNVKAVINAEIEMRSILFPLVFPTELSSKNKSDACVKIKNRSRYSAPTGMQTFPGTVPTCSKDMHGSGQTYKVVPLKSAPSLPMVSPSNQSPNSQSSGSNGVHLRPRSDETSRVLILKGSMSNARSTIPNCHGKRPGKETISTPPSKVISFSLFKELHSAFSSHQETPYSPSSFSPPCTAETGHGIAFRHASAGKMSPSRGQHR